MKRILIVSASFYPFWSPRSYRTTELAKELSRQGHSVTVLFPTQKMGYEQFEKEFNLRIKTLGQLNWKEVTIRGQKLEVLIRRSIKRLVQVLFEYPGIELMFKVSAALKKESSYDILISIAVPHTIHWGVAMVWNKKQNVAKKWIADCGDPYMLARLDTFRKPFYFAYLERKFCRRCNFITVPIEEAKKAYYSEFINKIRVIPQGFDLHEQNLPKYTPKYTYPRFAYAGGFIPRIRDPKNLLEYLAGKTKYFKFFIYTSQTDKVTPYKKILNDKIEIKDYVPREELLKILAEMDFLINLGNNTLEQLPSKLIDYSITGRPVLNIENSSDLSIIDEFLNGDYSKKMKLDDVSKYDIRKVASQFLNLT